MQNQSVFNRTLKLAWKPLAGIFILYLLVHLKILDLELLAKAIHTRPLWFVLAAIVYFLLALVACFRWFLLLRATGIPARWVPSFKVHMIGMFFSILLPGGTGGDFVKGLYVYRENSQGQKMKALSSIVMDRVIGLYGLLCTGLVVTLLNFKLALSSPQLMTNSFFYLACWLIATLMLGVFISPLGFKLLEFFSRTHLPGKKAIATACEALHFYRKKPFILLLSTGLTGLVHVGIIFVFFFSSRCLGLSIGLKPLSFAAPLITMINGIPLSPGGLGVSEAAGEVLLRLVGLQNGGSEILALYHACVLVTALIGLPFWLAYRHKKTIV